LDLSKQNSYLNTIIEHTLVIVNHHQFHQRVLCELCARVTKKCSSESNELQKFVEDGCNELKIEVGVDKFHVENVLMQAEVVKFNENKPCKIFVSQSVSIKQILFIYHHCLLF
jgi:hypothetical protein